MTSEEINNLRKYLGMTVDQFARLVQAAPESVRSWLYRGVSPTPLYLDVLRNISDNRAALKAEIELYRNNKNDNKIWQYVFMGVGALGAAYGIWKLLDLIFSEKK